MLVGGHQPWMPEPRKPHAVNHETQVAEHHNKGIA